jgi:predicted DsbA family dithiol-disulfide isomerase
MRVEVFADVVCPWCGLGVHRLEAALAGFDHRDDVDVVHRSFQLDPGAEGVGPTRSVVSAKMGVPEEEFVRTARQLEETARAEGLTLHLADNTVGNTALVHELLAHATAAGQQRAAWRGVLRAYWGERRPIFDVDSLVELAADLDLDGDVRTALTERTHRPAVAADLADARRLGIGGVPFFVLDGRYGVSGAQPAEALLGALNQVWDNGSDDSA